MFKSKLLLLSGCLLFFISACNVLSEEGPIPVIFEINQVNLSTNASQGSNTQTISDIWVNIDGNNLGVYPLPAEIALITQEEGSDIIFSAGIRNNGTIENPVIYPFYDRVLESGTYVAGQSIPITLNFTYSSETKFAFVEEFEGNHIFQFDEDGDGIAGMSRSTDALSGLGSGLISLHEGLQEVEVATGFDFTVPTNGTSVYLEMDYKNTTELLVGLIAVSGINSIKGYKIILKPQEDWNKTYIELTPEIVASGGQKFKILLAASVKEQTNKNAEIYVDNIKLLHF